MTDIVAVRMDADFLEKIDLLSHDEAVDRSTMIRELVRKGYQERLKELAAQSYKAGRITFSEAAYRAGLTLWEMQHYLVDKGVISSYSLEDLQQEMELIKQYKKRPSR